MALACGPRRVGGGRAAALGLGEESRPVPSSGMTGGSPASEREGERKAGVGWAARGEERKKRKKREMGRAENGIGKKERLSIYLKRFKHLQFKFKPEDSNLN